MSASLDPWQKDVSTRLSNIDQHLKDIASVQACALLYPPEQIRELRTAVLNAREQHRLAIEVLNAAILKLDAELGPQPRSRDAVVKALGQEKADLVYAEVDQARVRVAECHRALRTLEKDHPLINQLAWFAIRER